MIESKYFLMKDYTAEEIKSSRTMVRESASTGKVAGTTDNQEGILKLAKHY